MTLSARLISSANFAANPEMILRDIHRNHSPIFEMEMPIFGTCWVPTRHKLCAEVLKNKDHFVREPKNARRKETIFLRILPPAARKFYQNLVNKDAPDHRRLRALVDQAFKRRNVASMRAEIEDFVDFRLAKLAKNETYNISKILSEPLPVYVIGQMLGMNETQTQEVLQLSAHLRSDTTKWQLIKGIARMGKLWRAIGRIVDGLRDNPSGGLISRLWDAEESGETLSRDEIIMMVFALFFAGHETTVHLINGLTLSLIENPNEKEKLLDNPDLAGDMVSEGLRFFSPVTMTKPFYIAKRMQIRGRQVKRGQLIMPMVIAGNRDTHVFDYPHQFRLGRNEGHHLSFSAGTHFCLGSSLAEMETEIAVMQLFQRFPGIRLGVERENLKWRARLGLRAMKALPISI